MLIKTLENYEKSRKNQTFYQFIAWRKHNLPSGPIKNFYNLYIININKTLDRNEKTKKK